MKRTLLMRAYAHLGNITPIPADCGKLCGAKCCGGDADSGMILFPGELEFLSRADFLKCEKREMSGREVDFASCSGRCRRSLRPLSCRIFPLAPFWNGTELQIKPDPRAKYLCPLLDAPEYITPEFHAAVEQAFSLLVSDPEISDMLVDYTNMLLSYEAFTGDK